MQGTGLEGRISKKDVLDFVQARDAGGGASGRAAGRTAAAARARPAAAAAPRGACAARRCPGVTRRCSQPRLRREPTATASPGSAAAAQPQPQRADGDELIPMTPIRRAIAEHMVRSRHTSPHAWLTMEVDMVARGQAAHRPRGEFQKRYGVKLTYLPFVARAVCDALRQYPTLNASWSDEGIIVRRDLNLGIAVALEESLIVPVIRNADRLNIAGLAAMMQDLGDRARNNSSSSMRSRAARSPSTTPARSGRCSRRRSSTSRRRDPGHGRGGQARRGAPTTPSGSAR